ncbi:MAG: hypothetical protein AAGC77_08745 [Pseudomonadota bacterium]
MSFEPEWILSGISAVIAGVFSGGAIVYFAFAALLFAACITACIAAFRAANVAKEANASAGDTLIQVRDYAIEIRQLSAQAERASLKAQEAEHISLRDRIDSVRVEDPTRPAGTEDNNAAKAELKDYTGVVVPVQEAGDNDTLELTQGHAVELSDSDPQPKKPDVADTQRLEKATRGASEPSALLRGMIRRRR